MTTCARTGLWHDTDNPRNCATEVTLMTKRTLNYGLGWIESGEVTFTAVIPAEEPAGVALREALGLGDDGLSDAGLRLSRSDVARVLETLLAGERADDLLPGVLGDMIDTDDEDGDIILVHAGPDSDHPYATALLDLDASGRYGVAYGEEHWWPSTDPGTDAMPLIEMWAQRWPESLPIAHELKEIYEDRWVRFHSLPGSKRFPASAAEMAELLRRHNAVLAELTGAGEDLIVIVAEVATTPEPAAPDPDFWTAIPWHYADPDLLFAHLYVTTEAWEPGSLDELLRTIVAEEISGVIVAPPDLGWLYHPYAGGADVVLPDAPARDKLAASFTDWRSTHPSGL